jgi:hypothetical protein
VDKLLSECTGLVCDLDGNSSLAVATINDLINYDKIETKTFTIERKIVDIWAVVERTINLLKLHAEEKGVHMRYRSQLLHPGSFRTNSNLGSINLKNLRVVGDDMKLGQVIRNLVSNALKFTPPQGKVSIRGLALSHSLSLCLSHSLSFSLQSTSSLNMLQSRQLAAPSCRSANRCSSLPQSPLSQLPMSLAFSISL